MISSNHESKSEVQSSTKYRIFVLSIDFDGCIFHSSYTSSQSKNRLIETNEQFIQHVLKEIEVGKYNRVIFMVGSNRQSKSIDDLNSGTKGSCYPAILQLCDEIQRRTGTSCEVDKFLLADIYGNCPLGENFTNSINKKNYNYSEFIWDESKYSIIYSQMHKIASEHNGADILYSFYDDKDKEVLACLSGFYNKNKLLIPYNLNFRLYMYNGKELKEYKYDLLNAHYEYEVQGEGIIDDFYCENIKLIARCCGFNPDKPHMIRYAEKGMSETFYGDRLKKFKNERTLSIKNICYELNYEIKSLEQRQKYNKKDWLFFLASLRILFDELMVDVKNQEKQDIQSESILNNVTIKAARDTICMLRELQENNIQYDKYFNDDRKKAIIKYVDFYGSPLNYLKSSVKTITNSIFNLFYTPNALSMQTYKVAEQLKGFLVTDELEFSHMRQIHNVVYE